MEDAFERANILTIKYHLVADTTPIFTYVVMLDHDDNHLDISQETIEVMILVLCNIPFDKGVEGLELRRCTVDLQTE